MRLLRLLVPALLCAACAPLSAGSAPPPSHHTQGTRSRTSTSLALAQATHEYPGPPVREHAAGPLATPQDAVRAFALAYINWSAADVSADMGTLAARSVGQARSAMQLAAAQTAADGELQRGGLSNHGTVEAIASLAGRSGQYAVVTLEHTTAADGTGYQGLAPAWHVAVATVVQVGPGRWVLSGWQPQS